MIFRTYKSDFWKIDYPSNWKVELFANGVSFFDEENGVGAFQVSGYLKDVNVTLEDINELITDEIPADSSVEEQKIRNFSGVSTEYFYKDHFWRLWCLSRDKLLLYITYNCESECVDVEREIINQMINTLS